MTSSIVLKIRSEFSVLQPAEQNVARFVLENERQVIHYSITELAEKANTSEATVIRFCRKIGSRGFQEFKINLAKEMISPLQAIHEELCESDDNIQIVGKVYKASIQTIEDSLRVLDGAEFSRAVDALGGARQIIWLGIGGSGVIAKDAEHRFIRTGIPTICHNDVLLQAMAASLACPGDVVVGISHFGSTKSVVEAMQAAQAAGATTICITQAAHSPITKVSDIKLLVSAKETDYRSEATGARIAQLCLIDGLFVAVAKRRSEKMSEALDKIRLSVAPFKY